MMARSTNAPFKGRIQKRKIQIIKFSLQRTCHKRTAYAVYNIIERKRAAPSPIPLSMPR